MGEPIGRAPQRFTLRDLLFCTLSTVTCAIGACALAGSAVNEFSFAADITPAGLAVTFGLLALCLILRTARLAQLLAGLAFLCFGTIAAPETAALVLRNLPRSSQPHVFTVMTANVKSDNYDRVPFFNFVRARQPDVVVVVETYAFWRAVLEELQPEYRLAAGCLDPSACDVVILTRLAVAEAEPPPLSSRVVADLLLPQALGGDRIRVMGLHLYRSAPGAPERSDLAEAASTASGFGDLDVIAGDFNATPWGSELRRFDSSVGLERHTRWLPTWPAQLFHRSVPGAFAMAPIDHIYAGRSWRLMAIERGPNIGSDHYPVLATFARDRSL